MTTTLMIVSKFRSVGPESKEWVHEGERVRSCREAEAADLGQRIVRVARKSKDSREGARRRD